MRFHFGKQLVTFVAIAFLLLTGCTSQADSSSVADSPSSAEASETMTNTYANLPSLNGKATVELTVKGSKITIELNGDDAPITAGNFVDLVNRGVYNGLVFHRVVRQPQPFVVQGGDPQGKDPSVPANMLGTGSFVDPATGQPRYIPLEIKPSGADAPLYGQTMEQAGVSGAPALRHTRGAVAMARSQDPNSASSQFYFALADLGFLDGNYAVFGYVTSGMDVVDQIQQGDRIESAVVTSGLENLTNGAS
ncbi:peptidylprolyl isomerase [Leptolyngbya sp. AN02str]|uniref:peptidylprolyl isomerase n=1 Tax=Leptolyngbya sp. AN02str TaxID=3423363 RepID=UPI003D318B1B